MADGYGGRKALGFALCFKVIYVSHGLGCKNFYIFDFSYHGIIHWDSVVVSILLCMTGAEWLISTIPTILTSNKEIDRLTAFWVYNNILGILDRNVGIFEQFPQLTQNSNQ